MSTENAVPTTKKLTKIEIEDSWPTVYDVASGIAKIDLKVTSDKHKSSPNNKAVTEGLSPEAFPLKEGYFKATPEQLASLIVPIVTVGEVIHGFQRDARTAKAHVRKIAREMLKGVEMPPILVTITKDKNGNEFAAVSDGQNRSVASIISRVPVSVVVDRRTAEEAALLFANQRKAKVIPRGSTILTGNSPVEEYVQDALTSDDHPWSGLISATITGGDRRRIPVNTAATVIGGYAYNNLNGSLPYFTTTTDKFDSARADDLATIIAAFGKKTTNPLAFKTSSLKAITNAATCVFQRNAASEPGDKKRWETHMGKFLFEDYTHILSRHLLLTQALIDHWNKRLPEDRKVTIITHN
jgi:hypothetical protein